MLDATKTYDVTWVLAHRSGAMFLAQTKDYSTR